MGKIYSAPETIEKPIGDFSDYPALLKSEEKYVNDVIEWAKKNTKDKVNTKYIGEEFGIPMGDGHARYIVLSLKPVQMIHLSVGDAWDSSLANQVNAKYIKDYIDGRKRMKELFSKKS